MASERFEDSVEVDKRVAKRLSQNNFIFWKRALKMASKETDCFTALTTENDASIML
jgi:hypothetical protein